MKSLMVTKFERVAGPPAGFNVRLTGAADHGGVFEGEVFIAGDVPSRALVAEAYRRLRGELIAKEAAARAAPPPPEAPADIVGTIFRPQD